MTKEIVSKLNLGEYFDIGIFEAQKINPKLPEVNTTQLSYIPSASGNVLNKNEFVKGSDGISYFIDLNGNSTVLGSLSSIVDNSDGTVTVTLSGVSEKAIRPIDELTVTTTVNATADFIPIFDNATGTIKKISQVNLVQSEVLYSSTALSGAVPSGKSVGINTSTGDFYYKNSSGNWQIQPVGTTVNVFDNADGTVTINAALGGTQKTIRPIDELTLLSGTVDNANDKLVLFDASTSNHVYVTPNQVGVIPNVRFGTVVPVALGTDKKGDEYFTTPSGDNTTVATATYAYDGTQWNLRPAGGTALGTTVTPVGNISSTNVQAALSELDTEKLTSTLNSGQIFVGNGSNVATAVTASGDATISNTGLITVNAASDTVAGKVELATIAETETGTATNLAITPADGEATYIKKSLIDTKGNIIVGTGDNTPAILAPGTNGQVIIADSTAPTGLKYVDFPSGTVIAMLQSAVPETVIAFDGFEMKWHSVASSYDGIAIRTTSGTKSVKYTIVEFYTNSSVGDNSKSTWGSDNVYYTLPVATTLATLNTPTYPHYYTLTTTFVGMGNPAMPMSDYRIYHFVNVTDNKEYRITVYKNATTGEVTSLQNGRVSIFVEKFGITGNTPLTSSNGVSIVGNDVELGGTLSQTTDIATAGNNLTFSGAGKIGIGNTTPSATLDVNGSSVFRIVSLANQAISGTLTAATTVDIAKNIVIAQTTAGRTLTMPTPTNTTSGREITITNTGSTGFILGNSNSILMPNQSTHLLWTGSTWAVISEPAFIGRASVNIGDFGGTAISNNTNIASAAIVSGASTGNAIYRLTMSSTLPTNNYRAFVTIRSNLGEAAAANATVLWETANFTTTTFDIILRETVGIAQNASMDILLVK